MIVSNVILTAFDKRLTPGVISDDPEDNEIDNKETYFPNIKGSPTFFPLLCCLFVGLSEKKILIKITPNLFKSPSADYI